MYNTGSPAWHSCDDQEGWDEWVVGKLKREGVCIYINLLMLIYIYIIMTDSHYCKAEINTTF